MQSSNPVIQVDHCSRREARGNAARAALVLCVLLAIASCKPTETPSPRAIPPQHLTTLFAYVQPGDAAPDAGTVLAEMRDASRADPNWPVLVYLAGESHLKRKEIGPARAAFRDLAMWAASNEAAGPYKDGSGGSGLAVIGLWRWLQILDTQGGTPEEVEQALNAAAAMQRTRLFAGMVHSGLLPALPLVEEDVARLLAHVAAAAKRPEAMALYLDFMSLDSTGEPDATDQQLRSRLLDEEFAEPERLDLYQLRRQVSRVKVEERKRAAVEKLRLLWENQYALTEVRAEAGYEWGSYYRQSADKKKDVIAALSSVFELSAGKGSTAEKALYLRGMVQNSVPPRQPDLFFADMNRLLERFPNGRMADNALYQVATEYLFGAQPDPAQAFSYFERLRAFRGANDFLDSAYVIAALGMLERGTDADLAEADRLLARYLEQFPDGVFRLRSLFWRGRIAGQRGDTQAAQRLHQQLVAEAPFDYYGLRASMHLEHGAEARTMALPRVDSNTRAKLRAAYSKSVADDELGGATPYHERLRAAERNGLYSQVLAIVDGLGKRFRNRLDNIPLKELDESNLIPAAALLLALRQDAIAARDSALTADNQLQLAGFLGRKLADWPTAISMAFIPGEASHGRINALQNDPRYLASVYPGVGVLKMLKAPLAESAWPIDGATALSESLMYSVMRRESIYYPGAISPVGALGLFQIMPATFYGRKDCWNLRSPDEKPTPASYLFDPDRNTQFWSCWVRKEFEPKTRDSIALMLVKHHAGSGNLANWQRSWKGRAIENDLELQIETFRFRETQLFVRHVLTDVAIIDASGQFEVAPDGTGR